MTNTIEITEPHGYLRDSDGKVVIKFGNWNTGIHNVPDNVVSVDYVPGPAAHTEDVADKYKEVP